MTAKKSMLFFCGLSAWFVLPTVRADEPISFNRDVRPILSDRCFHCHGPDADNQRSDFRLDTYKRATADLGGYAGVVPGDLKKSELHARIRSDGFKRMPPKSSNRKLSDREKDILDRWIRAGAPYDAHWAFQPLPAKVAVPRSADKWGRNPVDQFIHAGMSKAKLKPNVELSREQWLRRVTFDLTGLPATLEEIDVFLGDKHEQAFERVVDRLLAGDACAERLTSEWLDVARYSDSYGYQRDDRRFVWPWRDWVIQAFRENMPYNRFITWQLAGDLLPDATREQVLATTFNRLHSHNKEGGVAVEEFRVEAVADRAQTVAAAFIGLTLECSRCHDHKYDPITMKDYYQLSAFFANVDERGLISFFTDAVPTPAMPLPSKAQDAQLAAAAKAIAEAEKKLAHVQKDSEKAFDAWLANPKRDGSMPGLLASLSFERFEDLSAAESKDEDGRKVDPKQMHGIANAVAGGRRGVTTTRNRLVPGKKGQGIQLNGDDAVVVPGVAHYERHQPFSISLWLKTPDVTERAVIFRRSRGWDDAGSIGYELVMEGGRLSAKLVHFWPGDAICVETKQPLTVDKWHHVVMTYDGSSKAAGLRLYLDGTLADTKIEKDHLTRGITQWRSGYQDLAIGSRYRDRGFKDGQVDEFRVFDRAVAALEVSQLYDGSSLEKTLATSKVTKAQRALLRDYYLAAHHEPAKQARIELAKARQRWNAVMDSTPAIMVMREQPSPYPTAILKRGAYDKPGKVVSADTPAFLPGLPKDAPRNRLGLARWLTSPDHPLTARVTVNRYWQMIFGNGLVATPEDFGNQSQPPTHPELLDWLARDFVDHEWDVHRLLRMLVLSATYRQSSVVSPEVRGVDPENRLLARGPSQRLSAEMIRDHALAVSGLLVNRVGGPPVRPYDVALAYTPLPVDKGEGLYRRSLYTYWQRTSPSPVMMTMDASRREVCRLRREVTASPLQALVLLNGPQFVEASRVLADRLLRKHRDDDKGIVHEAYRLLTGRRPNPRETEILGALVEEQFAHFTANPKHAALLLATGSAAQAKDLPAARHAAFTVLVNSIMNLDESVRNP